MKLSIIIPCYNEQDTICDIVKAVRAAPYEFKEIIIVDDCSNDGTRGILKNEVENLYIKLADMIRDFSEIEEISYDVNDPKQVEIVKTARILLNKEVYTHSFRQI